MKSVRAYDMARRRSDAAGTRDRIASAALELMTRSSYDDISLAGIAEAAGVSHQTVLNHFGSKDGVLVAVAQLFEERAKATRGQVPRGDTARAVSVIVEEYEHSGDSNATWAMSAHRLGDLRSLFDRAREQHQDWLARIFQDQLPAEAPLRTRTVRALHAATDVYTWRLLRRDLGLDRAETEATMVALVSGLLRKEGP